jgi:hypothetical protein
MSTIVQTVLWQDEWMNMLYGGNKPWQRRHSWFIRKYASFDEMKADEYRYWQSRPVHDVSKRLGNLPANSMR